MTVTDLCAALEEVDRLAKELEEEHKKLEEANRRVLELQRQLQEIAASQPRDSDPVP